MPKLSSEEHIAALYATLAGAWGCQHWWPAQSRFEVIVGAYLTQNTTWHNVEIALRNLRAARVLSVKGIRNISLSRLERLIRSSGYFRQKARKLKTFVRFLDRCYAGSLNKMFAKPVEELRAQLLSLNGVGPETADSILLYAGQYPVFVIDAYTRRIALRHGISSEKTSYEELRTLFERALIQAELIQFPGVDGRDYTARVEAIVHARPSSVIGSAAHTPSRMSMARRPPLAQVFNDMHGLIVSVGKQYCLKSKARCEECPLGPLIVSSKSKS
jgi:endonuclease-3 related protein